MTLPANTGESAEDLLMELRATMLLEQRKQLRAQRRGFQRIAAHVEYEQAERMKIDPAWPDAMPEYRRQRDALATAIAKVEEALALNGEALACRISDPFLLIERGPQDLTDTQSRTRQRIRSREYQRGLRVISNEEKTAA